MVAVVVFVAVWGGLLYALVRFRKRRGAVPAQIRGNTRLEVGWTVGAALILIALAVITFVKLPSIQNPPNSGPGGDQLAGNGRVLYGQWQLPVTHGGRLCNGRRCVCRTRHKLRDGMRRMSTSRPYCVSNCIVHKSQGSTETHRHEDFWARDGVHSRNLH